MRLQIPIIVICFLLCAKLGLAQSILNGSFEDNSFYGQYCNFDGNHYNEKMENSALLISYNSDQHIGVINEGCELNGDTWSYIFDESPPDGIWYLSLLSGEFISESGFGNHSLVRGFSLGLSSPLNTNQWYRLTFYIKAFPLLSEDDEIYEYFVDEPLFPAILTTYVEVGISENESTFGSIIGESIVPPQHGFQEWVQEEWILQEIVFNPSFAAEHITCRSFLPDSNQITSRFDLFVDHFTLEITTSIDQPHNQLKLYPNPVKDKLFIEGEKNLVIEIYDYLGRLHHQEQMTTNTINLEHLPKGMYLLKAKRLNGEYFHHQNILKS